MSQRYFTSLNPPERQNSGGSRVQSQRFSPQKTPSRSINFPRSSSEDTFTDFVPLDNSSPVQVRGRGGHWRLHNNIGHNSSFSPYNSNRSQKYTSQNRSFSFNKSQRYSPQGNRGGQHNNYRGSNNDLRPWYDPSMVEDPWAVLEKKLEQQQSPEGANSRNTSREPYSVAKNSSSTQDCYYALLGDLGTRSDKPKEPCSGLGDSRKSSNMTSIKENSPSLSERSVDVCTSTYVPISD